MNPTRLKRTWCIVALAAVASGCNLTDPVELREGLGRRLLVNEHATCALDGGGRVYCWGANSEFLEFGTPVLAQSDTPVSVPVPALRALAFGVGTHFCGIRDPGDAVCWGRGTFGQMGRGHLGLIGNPPGVVNGGIRWRDISLGRLGTCGVADDGLGYCWGLNQRGEVGSDTVPLGNAAVAPVPVLHGQLRFTQIAVGWRHACGVASTGQTFCWGDNSVGQLGNGSADTLARRIPTQVAGGITFTQLAGSGAHTCGIDTGGNAWCWGVNDFGQLGDGTTTQRTAPVRVSGGMRFRSIVSASGFAGLSAVALPSPRRQGGVAHTCALAEDGSAWCWGWNGNGQLGDGTETDRHVPTAVAGGHRFDQIGAGGSYTCGIRGNGVWCWGANLGGQLGNGTRTRLSVPTPVRHPFDRP